MYSDGAPLGRGEHCMCMARSSLSGVVLRIPERSLEIMRKAKDLGGAVGTVGKRRAGGTFLDELPFMCSAGSSRF